MEVLADPSRQPASMLRSLAGISRPHQGIREIALRPDDRLLRHEGRKGDRATW